MTLDTQQPQPRTVAQTINHYAPLIAEALPKHLDPDRFTREAEAARHPQAYHPFATGERVCIGNHFSLLESHLLVATLGRRFSPRLAPGHRPAWAMEGTLSPVGGMPMLIERRG